MSGTAPETLSVTGFGKAEGNFDRADLSITVQAQAKDFLDAMRLVQHKINLAELNVTSKKLPGVETTVGSIISIGPFFSSSSDQISVSRVLTFDITNSNQTKLESETEALLQVATDSGLLTMPQGSFSSSQVQLSYGFSPAAEKSLHALAMNAAIGNATSRASAVASSQGLRIGGISQITETSSLSQPLTLLSLLSQYTQGGSGPYVSVTVLVTFFVSKS